MGARSMASALLVRTQAVKTRLAGTGWGVLNRFREFVDLRCRPLIVAIGMAGETACPTLLDKSFGEVGGAGCFACRWKLISIAHPNPENGYAPRDGRSVLISTRWDRIAEPASPGPRQAREDGGKFWLDPVTLERAGGFSRVELNARLVQEHQERLLESWYEFFGRGNTGSSGPIRGAYRRSGWPNHNRAAGLVSPSLARHAARAQPF